MKTRYQHPINILESISGKLFLLIIPIFRTLIYVIIHGELSGWLQGAWLDLLVVLVIIGSGVYRWAFLRYRYNEKGLWVYKGILCTAVLFLPKEQISYLSRQEPWYLRPIRAVKLQADTDGGGKHTYDVTLTLTRKESVQMIDTLFSTKLEPVEERYQAKTGRIFLYALLNTNNLSGLLYFAAGLTTAIRLFGRQLEDFMREGVRRTAQFFSNSLSPVFAVLAAIVLLFWAGIFLAHLFYLLGFRCRRSQNVLRLSCGLISQHHTHMMVSRINSVTLVESNLSRIMGMGYATLRCSGYGKRDGANNLLVPSCSLLELRRETSTLLPEWKETPNQLTPCRCIWRYLGFPAIFMGVVTVLALISGLLVDGIGATLWLVWGLFWLPMSWLFWLRWRGYRHAGIGVKDGWVTIRAMKGYRLTTTMVHRDRIVMAQLRQSPFQKRAGQCDVIFHIYGEGRDRIVLPGLNKSEAIGFLLRIGILMPNGE